jgi:hypothetical protein
VHDAYALMKALMSVLAGGPDAALDAYSEARRKAAVESVQASADKNYTDLVAKEQEAERRNAEIRAAAQDPELARAYLLKSALLESRIARKAA